MVRHGVFGAAVGVVAMRIRVRALVRVLVVAVALATLSAPADAFPTSASVAPAPAELSMSGDAVVLGGPRHVPDDARGHGGVPVPRHQCNTADASLVRIHSTFTVWGKPTLRNRS